MPKGTIPHPVKKSYQGAAAWQKRKQEYNASDKLHKMGQRFFREDALHARMLAGTMTDKNWAEAERLGLADKKEVTR